MERKRITFEEQEKYRKLFFKLYYSIERLYEFMKYMKSHSLTDLKYGEEYIDSVKVVDYFKEIFNKEFNKDLDYFEEKMNFK